MNILIPHNWLLEHLETNIEPKKLQEYLSLCGPSVERIYDRLGDSIYDIEVTTNRVDAMSIRGIAREAAAILPQFGVEALLKPLVTPDVPAADASLQLPEIIENDRLNKRTLCVILQNVRRAATPDWMAQRLESVEMNIHDAAIDITNYITHELGHPCHAFDYDKLVKTGNKIIICEATAGEKFITLDGESFTTVGGEVVFKNGSGQIIDLPSIKGTANTSIDDTTKCILLLMESIDAKKVRFASMTHAIRTTAAQLMEKNVDPTLADDVLNLGVKLYQEICGAQVASKVYDHFSQPTEPAAVTLSSEQTRRYLGIDIPLSQAKAMLDRLDCGVKIDNNNLIVTPPSFRPDLTIPADIVEEVARLYGYHNLDSKLMATAIPIKRPKNTNFNLEQTVKEFLAALGLQEVYTYSLVSEAEAQSSGFGLQNHLKLANPLTKDKVYLRRSLTPSLVAVLAANPMYQPLSVFEIANVYHPSVGKLPKEVLTLGIVSSTGYRFIRGIVESLFAKLHIDQVTIETQSGSNQAQICFGKQRKLTGSITQQTDITAIQIPMSLLVTHTKSHPTYQPRAKTAVIREDLTFTLPEKTTIGAVMAALQNFDRRIVNLELSTVYNNNYTFTIYYHDPKQNLTSEQIAPLRESLVAKVEQDWGGSLVGQLT